MVQEKSRTFTKGHKFLNSVKSRKRSVSGSDGGSTEGGSSVWDSGMLRNFLENCASLDLTQKPLAKKAHLESPQQQSKGETSSRGGLHLLSFPNKLWRIVNSDKFKALRWDSGGVYLVVDVEMFPKEFLDCKERPRVFETNSTKGFLRLLNLYGFRKVKYAQERSASLSAFLEEENELSKGNKLLFFYNPSFQRGCEHRLHHMARRVRIKAGKVDGGAEKPGAGVEDGSEETAAASFQEGDRGAETYSGLKCEESSPSPPPSETAGSAWGNRAPTQKRDLKSEGLESEADPGIFSSHLLACVSNLSRSLLQVTSALTEASSHQAQDPAALSEQAQFQAMVSSWMFLCNTCFSLPMIMALFSKPKTPLFAPPSNPDRVVGTEGSSSATQP